MDENPTNSCSSVIYDPKTMYYEDHLRPLAIVILAQYGRICGRFLSNVRSFAAVNGIRNSRPE